MVLRHCRFLVLGVAPLALGACAEPAPRMGQPSPAAPLVGADLGAPSRVPQIAGLVGEGEFSGTSQGPAMPTGPGAVGRTAMEHASMAHGPMAQSAVDHAAMGHSMPGTGDRPAEPMRAAQTPQPETGAARGGGTQMAHSGHAHVRAAGTVNSVDAAARKVNVTHDPIPAIGWPTMTMDFPVAPAVDLNAVTPGTRVNFEMEQGQGGMYVIQSIAPAGARRQ